MAARKRTRPRQLWRNSGIFRAALLSLALLVPTGLVASPLSSWLGDPRQIGSSTFRFLGLPIYDARLFTPGGAAFSWAEDFGLQITYRKNISRKTLLDTTLDEMARQGNPAPTRAQLKACFRPITKGDTYLAISDGPNTVRFWLNGVQTCTLTKTGIKHTFMSVFLGDNSRSASFTRQLKGQ